MNLVITLNNSGAAATWNGISIPANGTARALVFANNTAAFGFSMNGGVRYAHNVTLAKIGTSTALPTGVTLSERASILV